MSAGDRLYERVYAVVRRVPRGRVATYGQVAALAGLAGHARLVGYALSALDEESGVPWHRVLNARGEVSPRSDPWYAARQRRLLEREGLRFDARGRLALDRYRWEPGPNAGRFSTSGRMDAASDPANP
ncbi:MAG: MGMT family protein [Gemmatimonadota bacterium]